MTTSSKVTWTDTLRRPEELVTRRTVAVTYEAAAPLASRPTPTRMARSKTAWSLAESVGTSMMVSHSRAQEPAAPRRRQPRVPPRADGRPEASPRGWAGRPLRGSAGCPSEVRRGRQHGEGDGDHQQSGDVQEPGAHGERSDRAGREHRTDRNSGGEGRG